MPGAVRNAWRSWRVHDQLPEMPDFSFGVVVKLLSISKIPWRSRGIVGANSEKMLARVEAMRAPRRNIAHSTLGPQKRTLAQQGRLSSGSDQVRPCTPPGRGRVALQCRIAANFSAQAACQASLTSAAISTCLQSRQSPRWLHRLCAGLPSELLRLDASGRSPGLFAGSRPIISEIALA